MGLFDNWFGKSQKEQQLDEAMKAFDKKYIEDKTGKYQGEGITDFQVTGYGTNGLTSFNNFYNKFINIQYQNEKRRIFDYRNMAQMPEISDVIEDAVIESTQEDEEDGNVIKLNIIDENISKNKNIVKNLTDEFEELFYNRVKIQDILFDWMQSYYIDGRLYYEKILNPNNHKKGILGIKQLPAEMMDYQLDPMNGNVLFFVQNLSDKPKAFNSIEEAEKDKNTIAFYPNQIGFINYGRYGNNKKQILGYLEKCKQPFNQLKLLETSVVIYRFIRSPERLVFKIDTGAMPIEKAMKFVQKVKEKMSQQVDFDPESGEINNKSKILSILSNFWLPQSSDGRGSDVSSIGGNPSGFAELDDLYYFQKKLYRSLKYPMSRVTNMKEGREGDIIFGGNNTAEITRDEIKWAVFLEKQQNKFANSLQDLFLLHLFYKGYKKQYSLDENSFRIEFNPPNKYKSQLHQAVLETRSNNYSMLSNNPEFSKSYLMRKYLHWDDEEIKANAEGLKEDKKLGFKEEGMF